MRIVALSDTHGKHEQLQVPDGDLLLFAGQPHRYKVMIAGNHDFLFEEDAIRSRELIPEGVTYLNDSGVTIEGVSIWGSPITPRFFDWAFNRDRGQQIEKHWRQIPNGTDILITHGPPAGILDRTIQGDVTGCEDLMRHVERVRPKLHVFGHIHEGYGMVEKNGTCFVNACNLDERYRMRNLAVVTFRVSSGLLRRQLPTGALGKRGGLLLTMSAITLVAKPRSR